MYICVLVSCLHGVLGGQERASGPLGMEMQILVPGIDPGPLRERLLLLTPAPSLQAQIRYIFFLETCMSFVFLKQNVTYSYNVHLLLISLWTLN